MTRLDKRTLLFIFLSAMVLLFWQIMFPPPLPTKRPIAPIIAKDTFIVVPAATDTSFVSAAVDTLPARTVTINRPKFEVVLSETGAAVHSLTLHNFTTITKENSESIPVALVSPDSVIPHLSLVMDRADRAHLARSIWRQSEFETSFVLTPEIEGLPPGIKLEKVYDVAGDYGTTLTITVTNGSGRSFDFSMARLDDPLFESSRNGSFILHLGPDLGINKALKSHAEQYLVTASYGKAGVREIATTDKSWWHSIVGLPDPPVDLDWVALENRYFTIAAEPKDFKVEASVLHDEARRLHIWMLLPGFALEPNGRKSFVFNIYNGPKDPKALLAFNPQLEQLDGMEPTVLPKKLPIARIMVSVLAWLNHMIGNWGWAIILLTVIVRALLFPLANYQFKSMAKMQVLKPKIDELQVRYAKDKERLQRELMKVYSEAGVNPVGGCLPLLLQMPIMIGLFIALQNSIELRGVPWILWIKDLSVPDTLLYVMGIPVNPLPLLMGVTMYFQQKITPMPSADPAQKQVMMMMPWIMMVMFYSFPSGLSLYWVTQNILSIAQQYYMLNKKALQPKEVPTNHGTK